MRDNSGLHGVIPYTISHALVHSFEIILPPLIPLILLSFNISYFQIGLLATAGYFIFGAGQIPAGIIHDRIGGNILVAISIAGASIFSIFLGFSSGLLLFAIFFILMNVFLSIFHPPAFAIVSTRYRKTAGRALGILGTGSTFGLAITPAVVGWLGENYSWNLAFILFGVIGLLTLPSLFTVRHRDERTHTHVDGKLNITGYFVVLILIYVIKGFIYRGTMTFLPAYISSVSTLAMGGFITSLLLVSGGIGQIAGGELVDRINGIVLLGFLLIMDTAFLLLMFWGKMMFITPIFLGMTYFSGQTVINVLISRFVPEHSLGAGYGIAFSIAFMPGSFASALSGYIADTFGLRYIFLVLAVVSSISVILTIILWRKVNGN